MALPSCFTDIRIDETGRRYVLHKDTGVRYLVREEYRKGSKSGPVTVATRADARKGGSKAKRSTPAPARAEPPTYATATFIEGSQP